MTVPSMLRAAPASATKSASPAPASKPVSKEPIRTDGRYVRTLGAQFERLKKVEPLLAFQPGLDRAAFEVWRGRVREKLKELLYAGEIAPQPAPKRLWSQPRQGYELQKWESYPEPFSAVPFFMLVPDGISQQAPAPAVMCFPGTGYTKERLAGEPELPGIWHSIDTRAALNKTAQDFARAGFVAIAMDHPGAGEQSEPAIPGQPGMDAIALQALWEGRSFEALNVLQALCVLEWLKQQPTVKRDRIAVAGHSFGVKAALHLAVLDESLAALVFNENGRSWRRRVWSMGLGATTAYPFLPGLLKWFDYSDLCATVAPRPVLFSEGMRPPEARRLRTAWDAFQLGDRMQVLQQPKFANLPEPADDSASAPPEHLTNKEWQEYAYVDPTNHFFKSEAAVPWLRSYLMS